MWRKEKQKRKQEIAKMLKKKKSLKQIQNKSLRTLQQKHKRDVKLRKEKLLPMDPSERL